MRVGKASSAARDTSPSSWAARVGDGHGGAHGGAAANPAVAPGGPGDGHGLADDLFVRRAAGLLAHDLGLFIGALVVQAHQLKAVEERLGEIRRGHKLRGFCVASTKNPGAARTAP
jgi:hypothetical protein